MSSFDAVRKPFSTPNRSESQPDSWSSTLNPTTTTTPQTPNRSYSTSTISDPWNTTPKSTYVNLNNNSNEYSIEENNNNNNHDEGIIEQEGVEGGEGYRSRTELEVWELGPQDRVEINQREELAGNFILKHLIWTIHTLKTNLIVERRYNDFVWLLDCFIKRYPFRILPSLPPKQISLVGTHLGTDDLFLERRRKGLSRFLCFAINHPVLKHDHLLRTFLSEKSDLSIWRKTAQYSLEEESLSRILTTKEEQSIPSSLESNLTSLTLRIHTLVDHWSEVSRIYDRLAHRIGNQGKDWNKLRLSMENVIEVERNGKERNGNENEVVERKILILSEFAGRAGELEMNASLRSVDTTVEELKRHRELYVNFRDLISRHVRLSPDGVDKLRKRTETNMQKLDQLRKNLPKPNFEVEVESLASSIEQDQKSAERLLRRRSFIRWAMYQEFVFLHRSTSLLSVALKDFATDELLASERIFKNWSLLNEAL